MLRWPGAGRRCRERRAESREQRADVREQRAQHSEQRSESRAQRGESREERESRRQSAESREQRAESREQSAESREQRAENRAECKRPGSRQTCVPKGMDRKKEMVSTLLFRMVLWLLPSEESGMAKLGKGVPFSTTLVSLVGSKPTLM